MTETYAEYHITSADMDMVYERVSLREMHSFDISELADDFSEESGWQRTRGAAFFLATRMHILIHGIVPFGMSEHRAEIMFNASNVIIEYIEQKGYNVPENVRKARDEVKTRAMRRTKTEAIKIMADYYKTHKDSFSPDEQKILKTSREKIIEKLTAGDTAKQTFGDTLYGCQF